MRNDANGTCFDVRVRTAQGIDEPIDALTPRCVVDGTEADASVARETVSTSADMPYRVRVETMSAQGSGRAASASASR